MDITFLGANCIKLAGRNISILYDPYDESYGLGKIKTQADVVLLSSPQGADTAGRMVIEGPGEFEVKESLITGISARRHIDEESEGERGTIYVVEMEGIRIAAVGHIAPGLSNEQLEELAEIDVLVVPVGGHGLTLDAGAAAQIVSQVEPKYVIPTHFADEATNYRMPQDEVKVFLSEMGVNPEPVAKLRLTAKEWPLETTVVMLSRAS